LPVQTSFAKEQAIACRENPGENFTAEHKSKTVTIAEHPYLLMG